MDRISKLLAEDDDESDEIAFPPAVVAAYTDALRRDTVVTAASAADTDESDAGSQIILGPQRKKHRTSGDFLGQDVAAAPSINLKEEEKLLMSSPQEKAQASQETGNVVQEEEELFLNEGPLRQKIAATMSTYGLTHISSGVERCLSLSAKEYLRRLITSAMNMSKQRADIAKTKDQFVITRDIRKEIASINQKAKEERDRRQAERDRGQAAEAEEILPQRNEKPDEITTANIAARDAVGGNDLASRWQLMYKEAQQKHEGLYKDSTSQAGSRVPRNIHTLKDHPSKEETCHVSLEDLIAAVEADPQMLKSPWIVRLYQKLWQSSNKQ